MFSKFPIFSRVFVVVLLPLAIACYFVAHEYLTSPLPQLNGDVEVEGLYASVSISRDSKGLTYIEGQNDQDVYFATGYAHAQDRLWQLEVQRRLSRGTLSEAFGRSTVERDIWVRTLGLYQAAEASLAHLSPQAVKSLEAYAKGINAWLKEGHALPIEFRVIGIEPQPWTVLDSLAWEKVFALNLAGNYRSEMQRLVGIKYLGIEQLSIFFPEITESVEQAAKVAGLSDVTSLDSLVAATDALATKSQVGGQYVGSNAWVVSGKLTQSGAPILSNDPHLGLQIPSLWYALSQKGQQLNVSGMSLVGLPVVVFGKNQHISWGGTNMMADVQDIFLEKINPKNSKQFWLDGQWQPLNSRTEIINVRADFPSTLKKPLNPLRVEVRSTDKGPVISDVLSGTELPMSLRWTALDDDDTTYESFFRLSYAKDWASFRAAVAYHVAPALNLFYADMANNIGFQGVGRVPIRYQGNGTLPTSTTNHSVDWTGYIPFADMPHSYNPEQGYLVNANNKNVNEDYPYLISHDFAPAARAQRIEQLLLAKTAGGNKLTVADMQQMQADIKDLSTLKLLSVFQAVKGTTAQQREAVSYLQKWQAQADKTSVAATLYYGWLRHLRGALFADELEGFWNKRSEASYLSNYGNLVQPDTIAGLLNQSSQWCDDAGSAAVENCASVLLNSLDRLLAEMEKLVSDDMSQWQWGEIQQTVYKHNPFSDIRGLASLFERRVATGGAVNTINVAAGPYVESEGYQQTFGAGFRQIIELSVNQPQHLMINSTGQSGQLASPFYDDMVNLFEQHEYIHFGADNVRQTITLSPLYAIEGK
ncbi:MAG: penicillin amidase [Phenylobacterium sp.]|jgi:penicillin amidase